MALRRELERNARLWERLVFRERLGSGMRGLAAWNDVYLIVNMAPGPH